MPRIRSQLDIRSDDFAANARRMEALVSDLKEQLARTALGGCERAR